MIDSTLVEDIDALLEVQEEEQREPEPQRFRVWGAAAELHEAEELELLADSGAGTGKSYSVLLKARMVAELYPHSRQLFCRQTRKSMNETILPMWENKILGPGHEAITGTASYEHRDSYKFPNGSVVTLLGLENVDRILSAELDRIYVFQGEETSLESHEKLLTRLRHGVTPYHQIVHDVNPAGKSHWLNRRPSQIVCVACADPEGDELPKQVLLRGGECPDCGCTLGRPRMRRILYRHEDNPRWYDIDREQWTAEGRVYVGVTLEALTGVRRERLKNHRWVSAEGLVWPEWDEARHLVTGELERDDEGRLVRGSRNECYLYVAEWDERVAITWFAASVDWGYTAPGCMQIWGFDQKGRAFRIREIYRTGERGEWWADHVERWHKEYGLVQVICDSAEPDRIDLFNSRLGYDGDGAGRERDVGPIAIKANKAVDAGLDLVGDLLGRGLIYFVRDANEAIDPELVERELPWRTEDEILEYVLQKVEGLTEDRAQVVRKRGLPDPTCADHGCDATRYMAMWKWGKDLTGPDTSPRFPKGSIGEFLDYGRAFDEAARREAG